MGRSRRQPEGLIQKAILEYLALRGIFAWGVRNGATYDPTRHVWRSNSSKKGISDIIGLIPPTGRLLAIEVKQPGKYPTKEQKSFLEAVRAKGGVSIVARSVMDVQQSLNLALEQRREKATADGPGGDC